MKVWYAVVHQYGGDSGEITIFYEGIYSDREKAKRALFDASGCDKRYDYEDLEWEEGKEFSSASINSLMLDCSEFELDAAMAKFG